MGRIFVSRFATIVNAYIYFSWKIISRIKLVPSGGDYSLSSRIPIYGGRNGEKLGGPWISPVNRHFIIGRPPWFFSLTPSSMPPTPLLLRVKEAPSWKNRQTDRGGGERKITSPPPTNPRRPPSERFPSESWFSDRFVIEHFPLPLDFPSSLILTYVHFYCFYCRRITRIPTEYTQNSLERKSSRSKIILFHRIVGKYFAYTRKVTASSSNRREKRIATLYVASQEHIPSQLIPSHNSQFTFP